MIRVLLHNIVANPIAGVLWAVGLDALGERVHGWWADSMIEQGGEA